MYNYFVIQLSSSPVLDVASGEYGDVLPKLISTIENGRLSYEDPTATTLATPSHNSQGNL